MRMAWKSSVSRSRSSLLTRLCSRAGLTVTRQARPWWVLPLPYLLERRRHLGDVDRDGVRPQYLHRGRVDLAHAAQRLQRLHYLLDFGRRGRDRIVNDVLDPLEAVGGVFDTHAPQQGMMQDWDLAGLAETLRRVPAVVAAMRDPAHQGRRTPRVRRAQGPA